MSAINALLPGNAAPGPVHSSTMDTFCVRTRVKICGITRAEDARAAVAAGADAIGVVYYEPSPRCAAITDAAAIRAAVPPFVSLVLVTVDLEEMTHRRWIDALRPDLLQFHGAEPSAACERMSLPYIKSLRMRDDSDVHAFAKTHPEARALLLDTFVPGVVGGTGRRFDWRRAGAFSERPVILAGGLDAVSVHEAIRQARPYALDVSSSLEASPGVKDPVLVTEFMQAVRVADAARSNDEISSEAR